MNVMFASAATLTVPGRGVGAGEAPGDADGAGEGVGGGKNWAAAGCAKHAAATTKASAVTEYRAIIVSLSVEPLRRQRRFCRAG